MTDDTLTIDRVQGISLVQEPVTRENLCLNGGFDYDGSWYSGINGIDPTTTYYRRVLGDERCVHVFRRFRLLDKSEVTND